MVVFSDEEMTIFFFPFPFSFLGRQPPRRPRWWRRRPRRRRRQPPGDPHQAGKEEEEEEVQVLRHHLKQDENFDQFSRVNNRVIQRGILFSMAN